MRLCCAQDANQDASVQDLSNTRGEVKQAQAPLDVISGAIESVINEKLEQALEDLEKKVDNKVDKPPCFKKRPLVNVEGPATGTPKNFGHSEVTEAKFEECKAECAANSDCHSFTVCNTSIIKGCYMKTAVVTKDTPARPMSNGAARECYTVYEALTLEECAEQN